MVDGDEPYVIAMNYGYTMEDGKFYSIEDGAPARHETVPFEVQRRESIRSIPK